MREKYKNNSIPRSSPHQKCFSRSIGPSKARKRPLLHRAIVAPSSDQTLKFIEVLRPISPARVNFQAKERWFWGQLTEPYNLSPQPAKSAPSKSWPSLVSFFRNNFSLEFVYASTH